MSVSPLRPSIWTRSGSIIRTGAMSQRGSITASSPKRIKRNRKYERSGPPGPRDWHSIIISRMPSVAAWAFCWAIEPLLSATTQTNCGRDCLVCLVMFNA